MKLIGWMLFTMICLGNLYAAPTSDSLRIYFHDGKSVLDPSLRQNQVILDSLKSRVQYLTSQYQSLVFSVTIQGNASPSGTDAINRRLSEERAGQLVKFLRQYVLLPDSMVHVSSNGVDWSSLERMVEADAACPQRMRVLDILRRPAKQVKDWLGREVDERKLLLLYLNRGEVYRWMARRYFGELRNSTIEIHAYRIEKQEVPEFPDLMLVPLEVPPQASLLPQQLASKPQEEPSREPLHQLAVKTNLLYDAILMPSLEIEYRLNDTWSLNLEGDMAWWKNDPKHKYYQLATVSPEVRYWFKTRKPWHGHYLGAFGGFSWYDLENGNRGYKGEAITTGLSYGYMFPIARNLSMEAGVGVGFMYTRYKEYLPIDGCYVYQQTEQLGYFGPLKLKLALVWRLWDRNKRKGGGR